MYQKKNENTIKKGQCLQVRDTILIFQHRNKGLTAPPGDRTQPMHDVDDIRVVRAATTITVVATTMCCTGFACP